MVAQILLLAAAAAIVLYFVSRRHNVRMQAGKRIGFFLFVALNIYAVLVPQHVTWFANQIGIGRGADLVLYLLVVAFVFGMLNTYLRFRGTSQQITELSRALAVQKAELVNRQRGVLASEGAADGYPASNPSAAQHPGNSPVSAAGTGDDHPRAL